MRNDLVVEKMIRIIEKLNSYINGCDYQAFSENDILVDACVFNLSQLGKTANKISEDYEDTHPQIPWREIYALRNRIVHDYDGVNLKLLWEILEEDLPGLLDDLKAL